jgi:hypothetical protein
MYTGGLLRKKRNSGQAVVEYIVLLTMVIGIMVAFLRTLNGSFNKAVPKMGGVIERQLRTGAASAGVWRK